MSIVEKLTEGMVQRDLQQEGAALLSKWERTGLLEGLSNERNKHTIDRKSTRLNSSHVSESRMPSSA